MQVGDKGGASGADDVGIHEQDRRLQPALATVTTEGRMRSSMDLEDMEVGARKELSFLQGYRHCKDPSSRRWARR